jgi:hypothetical protein
MSLWNSILLYVFTLFVAWDVWSSGAPWWFVGLCVGSSTLFLCGELARRKIQRWQERRGSL